MAANQNKREEEAKKVLTITNGISVDAILETGEKFDIHAIPFRPIVDAHMHIQSLNATPMTLQWATGYRTSSLVKEQGSSRQSLTRTASGKGFKGFFASIFSKEFGKVGQFSTDLIARAYMNESKNGDMKKKLYWLLWDEDEIAEFEKKKKSMLEEAGKKLGLEELSRDRQRDLQDFYKMTAYYYHRTQTLHMSIVMPMDLSYAHFWGEHGHPIYLPVPGGNSFYYIDDFVQLSVERDWTRAWLQKNLYLKNIYEPENRPDDHIHHMSYDYNLKQELENYLYYMGNKFGLPGYDDAPETKPFLIVFDHERLLEELERRDLERKTLEAELYERRFSTKSEKELKELEADYKKRIAKVEQEAEKILSETKKSYSKAVTGKKYKHIIAEVPGDNTEMFEDYYLQRAYTEASAFRYPLQLIPFYHYEPRRYYSDSSVLKGFAEKMKDKHGYYRLKYKEIDLEKAHPESRGRAELTPFKFEDDYYLEMFTEKYLKNKKTGKEKFLAYGSMEDNRVVLNKLYPNGAFMGVKVYPPLGYPGDLYNPKRKNRDNYYDGQFENLKEIYKHCIKHNLPITSHCSPLGMSISDCFNYEIRDELKNQNGDMRTSKKEFHDIKRSALYVDEICSRPDNWRRVLEKHRKLKLCLAHFSGMDNWSGKAKDKGLPDWRDLICGLINDFDNVYTDISCYTMSFGHVPSTIPGHSFRWRVLDKLNDSRDKELIQRFYKFDNYRNSGYLLKVYNDEERSMARSILRKAGYINDDINKIGRALAKYINDHSKLKERILMGSDWYMSETSITGVGSYYARMFELLKLVTKEVGNSYDAWHQFSVVNPLNYLGLLKTKAGGELDEGDYQGKKIYKIDIDRVETLLENLRKLSSKKEWLNEAEIKKYEVTNFASISAQRLVQLKKCKIYTAEEMKKDGNLIITFGQEV